MAVLFERRESPEEDLRSISTSMLRWHAIHLAVLATTQTEAAFDLISIASNPSTSPQEAARLYASADRCNQLSDVFRDRALPFRQELEARGESELGPFEQVENLDEAFQTGVYER